MSAQARRYYERGKLVRREVKGKPGYFEFYENGELDRAGFDRDGDGQVDQWVSRKK